MTDSPVPDWVPDDLPAAPGVYRFRNAADELLYVGKSVDLRRRIRGYFYGGGPDSDRIAEMIRLSRHVEVRRTGTEIEARLLEARAILQQQPPYNRALKGATRGWYLELDWARPFPRFRIVRATRRTSARYLGPFRSRTLPREIARLTEKVFRLRSCDGSLEPSEDASPCLQYGVGLCTAPCIRAAGLNEYRRQVEEAMRTLDDARYAATVRRRLVERREAAADRLAFEEAADIQRRVEWLDELESRRYAFEQPALRRSWLVVLPHVRPGRRLLLPVARGRVLDSRPVSWRKEGRVEEAVKDVCYAVRVAELTAGSALPTEELVPSLIVSRWMEEGASEGLALSLDDRGPEEVLERVRRACERDAA